MYSQICSLIIVVMGVQTQERYKNVESPAIDVIDLSQPTSWRVLSDYYRALEKNWRICINCGIPGLGTAMHLEHALSTGGAMHPAVIPTEYLLAKLVIIDVTSLVRLNPTLILTLEVALQWVELKHDPREPTLLLFKFGWAEQDAGRKPRSCVCRIPGISYELAQWLAANMTHVVGVATDAPTLESEETREMTSRTVSNLLGRNGIYMIDNVKTVEKLPERGCMVMAMPLKLQNMNYVPARLTAFCPVHSAKHVVLALRSSAETVKILPSRANDINLEDIMS